MRYVALMLLVMAMTLSATTLFEVETSGQAKIESQDTLVARSAALEGALKKALLAGVKNHIPEQSVTANMAQIEEEILSRPAAYVSQIEIISEGIDSTDNQYHLNANFGLRGDNIEADLTRLGLLTPGGQLPRIMFLVQEKNIDDVFWHFQSKQSNITESVLQSELRGTGFQLADQVRLYEYLEPEAERAIYVDDSATTLRIAREFEALVVITGKAVSRSSYESGSQTNGVPIIASVTLEAYRTDNAQLVATGSGTAELFNSDEIAGGQQALSEAAAKASRQILAQLNEPQGIITGQRIMLIVNGLKSIEDLVLFKREFQQRVNGLKSIEQRTFSGGTASYDLVAYCDAVAVGSDIISKPMQSFDVEIRTQSPSSLELNVRAKP